MQIPYNKQTLSRYSDKLRDFVNSTPAKEFHFRNESEESFAKYLNADVFRFVNSGTSALLLALKLFDIKEGDEVIGPSFGHIAWYNICNFLNVTPVCCDINSKTLSIDYDSALSKVTKKTKAIVFINMNGYVGEDLIKLKSYCYNNDIKLIEDSCNAFGSKFNNTFAGCFGDAGAYSFSTPKIITCNEGGAIVTKKKYKQKLEDLIYQGGWYSRKEIGNIGLNFHLSIFSIFLLNEQLKDIDLIMLKRYESFNVLQENKKMNIILCAMDENIGMPMNIANISSSIFKKFHKFGIETKIHNYPTIDKTCEIANEIQDNLIYFPTYLSYDEAKYISGVVDFTI